MSQSADMDALNLYIAGAPLRTKAAGGVHDEWVKWFDGLSYLEKALDSETWDRARNLRNQFNEANAVTTAEREAATRMRTAGLTTEEIAGGTRRALSTGDYDVPLLSTSTRLAIGGVALLAGVGFLASMAAGSYLKPFTRLLR
jgi:hypothetical protein